MILTCPACQTKYVVKDGAIPTAGRQVRCASCKHSWHQDPEEAVPDQPNAPARDVATDAETEVAETARAIVEQPGFATTDIPNPIDQIRTDPPPAPTPPSPADDRQWQKIAPVSPWEDTPAGPQPEPDMNPVVEDFEPFYDHEPIDAPKRRWPMVLLAVLMIALAAVAFWFLAPSELRARAGLASATPSQLRVLLYSKNYQQLASGNTLFTVSGRIINTTDARQPVPPIRAELLDQTKQKIIHSWTISPPVSSLDLNKSADFNSAEVDVPEGGKFIRLKLGAPA